MKAPISEVGADFDMKETSPTARSLSQITSLVPATIPENL